MFNRVIVRSREFAIQMEMQQLESAIENFKTENGFYPPSFKNMDSDTLLTYLNRIAPNHIEGTEIPWFNAFRNLYSSDGGPRRDRQYKMNQVRRPCILVEWPR